GWGGQVWRSVGGGRGRTVAGAGLAGAGGAARPGHGPGWGGGGGGGGGGDSAERVLPDHGRVRYRRDGEDHGWSPPLVTALQREGYAAFRSKVSARRPAGPRDLLSIRGGTAVPVEAGEPVEAIR